MAVMMIESQEGVRAVEEIAAVPKLTRYLWGLMTFRSLLASWSSSIVHCSCGAGEGDQSK